MNAKDCARVRDALSAWIDGEATPGEARVVESHLADCDACRAERASLDRTRALVAAGGRLPAPETWRREVLRRGAVDPSPRAGRFAPWAVSALATAATVAILLVAVRLSFPPPAALRAAGERKDAASNESAGGVAERSGGEGDEAGSGVTGALPPTREPAPPVPSFQAAPPGDDERRRMEASRSAESPIAAPPSSLALRQEERAAASALTDPGDAPKESVSEALSMDGPLAVLADTRLPSLQVTIDQIRFAASATATAKSATAPDPAAPKRDSAPGPAPAPPHLGHAPELDPSGEGVAPLVVIVEIDAEGRIRAAVPENPADAEAARMAARLRGAVLEIGPDGPGGGLAPDRRGAAAPAARRIRLEIVARASGSR